MRRVRLLAVLDGVSYAVLVSALVAHLVFDTARLSPVLGPIHGMIYLFYAMSVLNLGRERGWDRVITTPLIVVPIIPLAGFYVAAKMLDEADAAGSAASS